MEVSTGVQEDAQSVDRLSVPNVVTCKHRTAFLTSGNIGKKNSLRKILKRKLTQFSFTTRPLDLQKKAIQP